VSDFGNAKISYIKLKSDFLKTQHFILNISKKQITLIPSGDNQLNWIIINNKD